MIKMREKQAERDALKQLIDQTNLDRIVMIEVGSYAGESADIFASSTGKVKTLYCVDPWKSGYDEGDIASYSSDFKEVENAFDEVQKKHSDVIVKYKGTLADFISDHPEVKPDLLYIDACHQYAAVKSDLISALSLHPKYLSGHDYVNGWGGVVKAVDEVLGKPDYVYVDGSWLKQLPLS